MFMNYNIFECRCQLYLAIIGVTKIMPLIDDDLTLQILVVVYTLYLLWKLPSKESSNEPVCRVRSIFAGCL